MTQKGNYIVIKVQIIVKYIKEQKWEEVKCDIQNDNELFPH